MVQSKKIDPEKTRRILGKHERSARLLANADFQAWRQEIEDIASMEALATMSPERSNFDRSMYTGVLYFIRSRFGAMEKQARPEALKKLRESLEESENARPERRAGKHEPTGFAGKSAIGEF